jgi:hypothetical protein
MTALELINLAAREYQDVAFERIAKDAASVVIPNGPNWLDWLNDAQRAVVLVRPDANAVTASFILAAGTKQACPAGTIRLLDVTRNMGAAGTTAGKTIRFAERGIEDMVDPDWHTKTAGTVVKDVLYDDKKDPLIFWTVPPIVASPAVYIEAVIAKLPDDVDEVGDDIELSAIYSTAMQQWMLHRAYAMATQALNQFQRANFYFTSFFQTLGIKLGSERFYASNLPGTFPSSPKAPDGNG